MFVLSKILIEYDFVSVLSKKGSLLFSKIFKISPNTFFIFIMALFTGFPSGSKYALDLYNKNLITKEDINKIMLFSHFSNPLFIIGTIGLTFLNNKKMGLIILISHYLANIIVGLIFRNKFISKNNSKQINTNKQLPFGSILTTSIVSSIETLLLVLGTVIIFSIVSNIIDINPIVNTIISGLLEMCNGLKKVSLLNISLLYKVILSCFFISFGGFSIHLQNFAILSELKINYKYYFLSRILQGIISILIIYFIFLCKLF